MSSQPGKNPKPHWGGSQFFTLPTHWVDSDLLATLKPSQLLTLLGLARHADFETGITRPGDDLLIHETNKHPRTVQRSRGELEKLGLIKCVKRGGGRSLASVYRLQNPGRHTEVNDTETAKTPAGDDTKTPVTQAQNPGGARPKPRRPHRPNKEEQMRTNKSNKEPDAADSNVQDQETVEANLRALEACGITGRNLAELARQPDMTPNVIEAVRKRVAAKNGAAGMVVNELRSELKRRDEKHQAQLKRENFEEREREQAERDRAEYDAIVVGQVAGRQHLEKLERDEPEQFKALTERAIDGLKNKGLPVTVTDWKQSQFLRAEMLSRLNDADDKR